MQAPLTTSQRPSGASSAPASVLLTIRSMARPDATISAPTHSTPRMWRLVTTRAIGSENTIVATSSGCTMTMRPIPSAIACATKPSPWARRPSSQTGLCASRTRNPAPTELSGCDDAAFSWSTSPRAKKKAATSAMTTSTRGAYPWLARSPASSSGPSRSRGPRSAAAASRGTSSSIRLGMLSTDTNDVAS